MLTALFYALAVVAFIWAAIVFRNAYSHKSGFTRGMRLLAIVWGVLLLFAGFYFVLNA